MESKRDELPFSGDNFTVKKLEKNTFEIYPENGEFEIGNLNLKDVVSIKENTPDLEEIIFKLFSSKDSDSEVNMPKESWPERRQQMKKYIIIALNQATVNLQYKFNTAITLISRTIPIFMSYFLWTNIYKSMNGSKVGNYTRSQWLHILFL